MTDSGKHLTWVHNIYADEEKRKQIIKLQGQRKKTTMKKKKKSPNMASFVVVFFPPLIPKPLVNAKWNSRTDRRTDQQTDMFLACENGESRNVWIENRMDRKSKKRKKKTKRRREAREEIKIPHLTLWRIYGWGLHTSFQISIDKAAGRADPPPVALVMLILRR